jgi:hypothetical protein
MINEPALRETLISLADLCKTQYAMLSVMMDEVAALRETVRGLDPTFSDVLEQKRKDQSSETIRLAALQGYNGIIRGLKDGNVC